MSNSKRSVASRGHKETSVGCLWLFSALFFLPGLAVFVFLLVLPTLRALTSANWVATPARVQSSEIVSVKGSKSTSYRADIVYNYDFGGRSYSSSDFSFAPKSSGGYDGAATRAGQYPAGANVICYVNPAAPAQAVLHRGWSNEYLFGLIGIPFMLVPLLILKSNGSRSRSAPWQPKNAAVLSATPGGVQLQTSNGTPASRVLGIGLIAAFWNGIVGVFVVQFLFKAPLGVFTIFPALFLIPFVLIGLLLLGAFVTQIGALFNPRVIASFEREAVRLGEEFDFHWELRGGFTRTTGLRVTLEGREEASFRRGTDTITEKSPFYFAVLHDSSAPQTVGATRVVLPAEAMHSFEAHNNKIVWTLKLEAPVSRWPDVAEEWKLNVLPRAHSENRLA